MSIRIDKGSDVAVHRQLAEQIVFLIATGKLKPGDPLPSVRAMALRHKIHPNTVSQAYQNLVDRKWIKRQRGKKMTVRAQDEPLVPRPQDLDDLIDRVVRSAYERGYTMQDLRKRMLERLLVEPPDHVLLVEDEAGMRQLLLHELTELLSIPVTACSPDDLCASPGLAIGALAVTLPGRVWQVASLLPLGRPVSGLTPSGIEADVEQIQRLKRPSVIVIVSISEIFLQIARGLLAPFAGSRHAIEVHCLGNAFRDSPARTWSFVIPSAGRGSALRMPFITAWSQNKARRKSPGWSVHGANREGRRGVSSDFSRKNHRQRLSSRFKGSNTKSKRFQSERA